MKKIILFSCIALMAAVLASCDANMDEKDRLIYVKPEPAARSVLIEDFTGQDCINCPLASEQIAALQEQYGADTVIAVGIHSGYFGVWNTPTQVGLRTEEGDEYYKHWGIDSQPNGVIDRSDGVLQYSWWPAKVAYDLQKQAPVSISLSNSYDASTQQISTTATVIGTSGETDGYLQLWVVEDSIEAYQLMPDGSRTDNYVHRHVFRRSVNGTWGEHLTLKEGDAATFSYTIAKDTAWNPHHVSIVAFVYGNDAEGVRNATQRPIMENK